jgi:hypothetical protein
MPLAPSEIVSGVAVQGTSVAAVTEKVTSEVAGHPDLPLSGSVYVFSRPPGTWKGAISPSSSASVTGFGVIAIDGDTVAAGGKSVIDLFTRVPGSPAATSTSLTGAASGKPTLRMTLYADPGAPPIRSFALTLPRGLLFTGHGGVRVNGERVRTIKRGPTRIAITLSRPAAVATISISPPAVAERGGLIAAARRVRNFNRSHRRKRLLTLNFRAAVTDSSGHATSLIVPVTA